MKPPIPILRSFDETKAKEFYITFLGFKVDWEHRFADDAPLYMQVSRGDSVIHLSEHHGDCSPGARIRIEMLDLEDYLDQLRTSRYRYARPGKPVKQPWGLKEVTLYDPFCNRLTLYTE